MTEAEILKRRLRWKCRRGMLELDILFFEFFDNHYDKLNESDKLLFARVLELEDTELYACMLQSHKLDDPKLMGMISRIAQD